MIFQSHNPAYWATIFSKIDYAKIDHAIGYLDVSGINVPFFSPETIITSSRSESLFYVRVENPEIKIGYIPKLKIAHGIYLGDIIVENVSGKAYLNVISTLDEEVQVLTLRLKSLNKLFDNYESNVEAQDNQKEVKDMQFNSIQEDNQTHCEISNTNDNSRDDKEGKINNNEYVMNEKSLTKENNKSNIK